MRAVSDEFNEMVRRSNEAVGRHSAPLAAEPSAAKRLAMAQLDRLAEMLDTVATAVNGEDDDAQLDRLAGELGGLRWPLARALAAAMREAIPPYSGHGDPF